MKKNFLRLLFWVCRRIFSLRYSVKITGWEKLTEKQSLLFLPNHTALLDPLLLSLYLWPKFQIRPLVLDLFTRLPFAGFWISQVRPIPIPDFETAINQFKIVQADRSLQKAIQALKEGDNLLVYPAGKLKNQAAERIGGNSAVHTLLEQTPECRPVLVRISGFWGSSFSKALTGKSPSMGAAYLYGFKTLLKNLFFFTPRRKISVHFELAPADFPKQGSRRELNAYLEGWYNQYEDERGNVSSDEPLRQVSYAFWKTEYVPVLQAAKSSAPRAPELSVSPEAEKKIYDEIRKILKEPGKKISPEMNLTLDLGLDSLNLAELIVYLSRNYETPEIHPADLDTVQSALAFAAGEKKKSSPPPEGLSLQSKQEIRLPPSLSLGKNIPETILQVCKRMGRLSAVGDAVSGELDYRKLLRAVLVLSRLFRKFPEKQVGVMLPSSVGGLVAVLALQFAGKVPVMLNWTLGPRYLEQMMEISGAKRIISSWKFFERLSYVEFGPLVDRIEFLEDLKQSLPLRDKLYGALFALTPASLIKKACALSSIRGEDPAVILFTSGSEAAPKGVPLSHFNILSDMKCCFPGYGDSFTQDDVLLAVLPLFHSFGFSGSLFFISLGVKTVFSPDPTDSFAVAQAVHRWKATSLFTVPLFLQRLLHTAKKEQICTLRELCVGGDKAPPDLYEAVRDLNPKAILREGYGVTECSPVVAIQRVTLPPEGAGQLVEGVEAAAIHLETLERLPEGTEGEICISGPIVFNGYLGTIPAPFLQMEGKRWYRTGDIGRIASNRSIYITGRIKRFAKIGGEMISLGAIEDCLIRELRILGKGSQDAPSVAVCALDSPAGPRLIVFSTCALEKEQANELLRQAGFSRLIKIDEVRQIDEMPLMGSGKTNYRSLQSLK